MNPFEGQSTFFKITFVVVLLGLLVGAPFLAGVDNDTWLTFITWAGGALIVLFFIFWGIGAIFRRGRSQKLFKGLSQQAKGGDYVSLEDEQAAHEIQAKFQEGLTTLRKRKINLYQLPWYLVIGESGEGKTEAIRNSRIDLIQGLHDPNQGKGGTRDMHWWFTANSVLIDTAGRMVFPELKPKSTPAWMRLLDLLKQTRPHCPVNGILLMISAESLIQFPEQEVRAKADKIAKEIYSIRDALDLRVPVYVLVTKCDRIPGFSEFFGDLPDADQMFGWSNPAESFRADDLAQHLAPLNASLHGRRSALLRQKSTPTEPSATSESSQPDWFAFPDELARTYPNLELYLRTVFPEEGAFSGKKPFMRGIYFTSAMHEGSTLDVEVAKKFAVGLDELPMREGSDEKRSYFLRDLFREKIFREKGMVTPETDTRRLVWKRKALTLGVAYVALAAASVTAFWGVSTLQESIAEQQAYWVEVADAKHWEEPGAWSPTILFEDQGEYFSGEATPLLVGGEEISLVDFHVRLHELAAKPIELPPILQPLQRFTQLEVENNLERAKVQRLVFERGVLKPLYRAARDKMLQAKEGSWNAYFEDALVALIRLEVAQEQKATGRPVLMADFVKDIEALNLYLTGKPGDVRIAALMESVYRATSHSERAWPPVGLAAGGNLKENAVVGTAIKQLLTRAQLAGERQWENLLMIKDISVRVRALAEVEQSMLDVMGRPTSFPTLRDYIARVKSSFGPYEAAKQALDKSLAAKSIGGLLTEERNWLSLRAAHATQMHDFEVNSVGELDSLLGKLNEQFAAGRGTNLVSEIKLSLKELRDEIVRSIEPIFASGEADALRRWDDQYLKSYYNSTELLYQHRNKLVKVCYAKMLGKERQWKGKLGTLPDVLTGMKTDYLETYEYISTSKDRSVTDFHRNLSFFVDYLEKRRVRNLGETYLRQAKRELREQVAFPVVIDQVGIPMDQTKVLALRKLLIDIRRDLPDPVLDLFADDDRRAIKRFLSGLNTIEKMADVFFTDVGEVRLCEIEIPEFFEHKKMLKERFLFETSGLPFSGDIWKIIQLNRDEPVRTNQAQTLGRLPLSDPSCSFTFYRFANDLSEEGTGVTRLLERTWAPLQQVYEGHAFASDENRIWDVPIWINIDEETTQPFFLRFKFIRSLPASKEEWPTLVSLGLD